MAEERVEGFETVPTLEEKGLDISIGTWRGLAVPAVMAKDHAFYKQLIQKLGLKGQ